MTTEITNLEPMIESAIARFNAPDAAIAEMGEMFAGLVTNGPEDRKAYSAVREARLNFRNVRIAVEKTRKELKADALTYSQAIDGEARRIKALIEPHESRLQAEEQKVKDEEARREAEAERLKAEETERRVNLMADLGQPVAMSVLEVMDAEAFAGMVETARQAKAEREAARIAAEEEAKRVAAEQAKERERLAEERRAAEIREAKAEEVRRAERAEAEAKAAKEAQERAEAQAKLDADRRAFEAEKAEAERVKRESAEAEARQAEEARAATEKQAAIDAQVAEAKRVEALAPLERIAERLDALAASLDCPELAKLAVELREVAS